MVQDLDDVMDQLHLKLNKAMENRRNDADPSTSDRERFVTRVNVVDTLNDNELIALNDALSQSNPSADEQSDYLHRIKEPSRYLVLGIIIHTRRQKALRLFKSRLSSPGEAPDFPTDDDLPLSFEQAESIFDINAEEVLRAQPMFLPMIIRKHIHQDLQPGFRKPYIQPKKLPSGNVYKVRIPPGYWEYEETGELRSPHATAASTARTKKEIILAVKRFRKDERFSSESASENYQNERNFLANLRNDALSHQHILYDLGSITEQDGGDKVHDLLFPFAECDLFGLLTGRNLHDHFRNPLTFQDKFEIFKCVLHVVDALSTLHLRRRYHLDIKPENILVFREGPDGLVMKIADFNFSLDRGNRPVGLRDLSARSRSSPESFHAAARVEGVCQAPEVRELPNYEPTEFGDVWSIGCVLLMVLSYLDNREESVSKLYDRLALQFRNISSKQKSFYMTPEMEVPSAENRAASASSLSWFNVVPNTETSRVCVNPNVLEWMNVLHHKATQRQGPQGREAKFLEKVFSYMRENVMVADRTKRVTASKLHESLEIYLREFVTARTEEPASPEAVDHEGESESRVPINHDTPLPVTRNESVHPHSEICNAARSRRYEQLEELLNASTDPLQIIDERCRNCSEYPLHIVVMNQNKRSISKLLGYGALNSINAERASCRRTPIELASEGGDRAIVKELLDRPNLRFDDEIWQRLKHRGLKQNVRGLLSDTIKRRRNSGTRNRAGSTNEGTATTANDSNGLRREMTSGTGASSLRRPLSMLTDRFRRNQQ